MPTSMQKCAHCLGALVKHTINTRHRATVKATAALFTHTIVQALSQTLPKPCLAAAIATVSWQTRHRPIRHFFASTRLLLRLMKTSNIRSACLKLSQLIT